MGVTSLVNKESSKGKGGSRGARREISGISEDTCVC